MAEKEKLSPSARRKRKKGIIVITVVALLVIAGVIAAVSFMGNGEDAEAEKVIMTTKAQFGTIELTVSGSGTVEPLDRYEIVSLVSGDITSAPYEEGDLVNEDDVVFVIDHEEQNKSIESAENSLTKSKIRNKVYLDEEEFNKTLAKYTVRAEEDGIISGFKVEVDDKVNANAVLGTIQNFDEIIATVPFNAVQFGKINEGDSATVYLYPSMYTREGIVTYKSYKTTAGAGGAVVYDVEITFDGSNMTLTDTSVSATVHTASGDVDSPASGTLGYAEPVNIAAEVSGEVLSVSQNIKNGAKVKKGDVLFKLDTSDFIEEKTLVEMDYKDLELNLENARDRLENYNIKSPISGTVITKNVKKGDTVSSGNNGSTLMVIADMSAMKFTFQADETDIEKIDIGQSVKVTADAVVNKVFTGIVESVATEGVSSNGVSYYDVGVVIQNYGQNDESGMLRSGMNVSAEIVYEKSENALCVPVSAITTIGNESYVFVKGTTDSAEKTEEPEETEKATGKSEGEFKRPEGFPENMGERPEGMPEGGRKSSENSGENKGPSETGSAPDRSEFIKKRLETLMPEGFTAVKVEIGASNGTMVAVLSGIDMDDEIYIAENNNVQTPVSTGNRGGLQGGMMGGGMMGGMPMGGMAGGMRPSGNMGGMRR